MTSLLAHRIAIWVLTVALAIEGAVIASAYRDLRSLETAQSLQRALTAKVAAAEYRVVEMQKALRRAGSVEKIPTGPAAPSESPRLAKARAGGGVMMMKALEDPRFRQDLAIIDRNYNRREVVTFLRTLGLSPDQIEQVLDLMGQMMIAKMDAEQTGSAHSLDSGEREEVAAQTEQDLLGQLSGYLGDARFASYEQWVAQAPVRSMADNLRDRLSFTSQPLTDSEFAQFVDAVYQASPDRQAPLLTGRGALEPTMPKGRYQDITAAELTVAETVLAPRQMAAFRELAEDQAAAIRMGAVIH